MNNQENNTTEWLFEITQKNKFSLNLKEVKHRDLLMLFVKRRGDGIQTNCFRTALLIQPLFTSITFTIIFNNLAGISTGTVPVFV
jgi:lipopolysaccharide transport system permease protein